MTPLSRRGDWKARLNSYLLACRAQPFVWGEFDCAFFVDGAIEAQTDVSFGGRFRGRYHSYSGGLRMIRREAKCRDHLAFFAARLPEAPLAFAAPGDVVAVETPEGPGLGIVQGAMAYHLTDRGMTMVPIDAATRLLKVGANV